MMLQWPASSEPFWAKGVQLIQPTTRPASFPSAATDFAVYSWAAVTGHATGRGQNADCAVHAIDIFGGGFLPNQEDVFASIGALKFITLCPKVALRASVRMVD